MARTKQTARKNTGGKAPRKQLATKVHTAKTKNADPLLTIDDIVRREIPLGLVNLTKYIQWNVNQRPVTEIRYNFGPEEVGYLLQHFTYQEPHPDQYEYGTLAANHPVVNRLFNTPLNLQQPVILYFDQDGVLDRQVYDNINTIFDLLGAIYTYYGGRVNNPLAPIEEYEDGFRVTVTQQ